MHRLWPYFLFVWAGSIHAQSTAQKCSPALQGTMNLLSRTDNHATDSKPMLFTLVVTDLAEFRQWAQQNGLAEQAAYTPAGVILLEDQPRHFFETTLRRKEVIFADLGYPVGREELPVPGHNLFVNNIPFVHARWPALDGRGTTISIKEFRFDSSDVDVRNRYLPTARSAHEVTTHANIMVSLAAGAGTSDPAGRGVARGSRVVSSSFIGLLPDQDTDYDTFDISVQNHSYGLDIENYYGAGALAYDESVQRHGSLLHVFSAGNQGTDASTSGVYANLAGFANLTGNFKMAKNVLVVGAVDSFGQVAPFSSRGPAYDGRIKPDLVAFGHDGTSESAALVSGSAAIVRQAFFEKYAYWPSSDLVKAILIGAADDLGSPGPDFMSGYGNLNLKKAVELVAHQFIAKGEIAEGQNQVLAITMPDQISQFTITLSWNDASATPNAARALVNDLDLSVQGPDGTFFYPWVLSAYPDPDSLLLPAHRGRDSINTLEQVGIANALPGSYQVFVRGKSVATGQQSFALAFRWDTLHHFEWTCPVYGDPALTGKEAVLRWKTTLTAEKGHLEWKPAGSSVWQTIDTAIVLSDGYKRWLMPDTVTSAQLRMRTNAQDFVSDTFLIAPAMRLHIGFNCPDSVLLRWAAVGPNLAYRMWGLGDQYIEPLFITADTAIILPKDAFPQHRFAISALRLDEKAEGPISGAPDIFTQGVGCYINTLLAFINTADEVELTLSLGTLYGVRKVFIEKWQDGDWVLLAETSPTALNMFFADLSPQAGKNMYRASVLLVNGSSIVGDPVTIYFAGKNGYLVLPNPVASDGVLTVLARVTDEIPRFVLWDALGRVMLERVLDDSKNDINLPSLPTGYYVWMVMGEASNRLTQGKLLVKR